MYLGHILLGFNSFNMLPTESTNYQWRPTGTTVVSIKTNIIPIITIKTITGCFINKVREEHNQIINHFSTGGACLVDQLNLHDCPPSRQHAKYAYYLLNPIICKCKLVNSIFLFSRGIKMDTLLTD